VKIRKSRAGYEGVAHSVFGGCIPRLPSALRGLCCDWAPAVCQQTDRRIPRRRGTHCGEREPCQARVAVGPPGIAPSAARLFLSKTKRTTCAVCCWHPS